MQTLSSVSTDPPTLLEFIRTYLPHHLYGDPAPYHFEIQESLNNSNRTAIAAPRGHGKSSLITLGYVLYALAYRKRKFVVLIGASSDLAEKSLGRIGAELRENTNLLETFPHLKIPSDSVRRAKAKKAKDSDLQLSGGARLAAVGAGAALRGLIDGANRPDEIILDDIETDQGTETPEQREKLLEWFLSAVSNLPGASGGSIRVVGTILHKKSLLATLLSEQFSKTYTQLKFAALDHDGNPLWPAAWTLERLEQKRLEIGSRAFSREYLNNPLDSSQTLWQDAWISDQRVAAAPPLEQIVVALDPSTSADGERDACGIVVAGYAAGRYYVLHDATLSGSPSSWARKAIQIYHQYNANLIVAEGNQGGAMVKMCLTSSLRQNETLPLIRLVHASVSKVARAEPIAALYEEGSVSHVGNLFALETEMLEWIPGMKSPNRVDALVWALTYISQNRYVEEPEPQSSSHEYGWDE